jgi:hypothetical protein
MARLTLDVLFKNETMLNRPLMETDEIIINDENVIMVLTDKVALINDKVPREEIDYLNQLKNHLSIASNIASQNKEIKMNKAKLLHSKRLKTFNYKIDDLVL